MPKRKPASDSIIHCVLVCFHDSIRRHIQEGQHLRDDDDQLQAAGIPSML